MRTALGDRGVRKTGERREVTCRGGGIVQPTQCYEAGQEFRVQHLLGGDLAVTRSDGVGAGRIAVPQQTAGEQVALGPERPEFVPRRVPLCRLSDALPYRQGVRGAIQMAQPPGMIKNHARIGTHGGWESGKQCTGVGCVALQGEPCLGRRAMRGVEAWDLACRSGPVVPGKVLETLPLVLGPYGA